MDRQDHQSQTVEARPRASRFRQSVLFKILLPALLGVVVALVIGLAGVVGVGSVSGNAQNLYQHEAKPLADFAKLRDDLGDSRWETRDYVLVPAPERAALRQAMLATDSGLLDDLNAIVKDSGPLFDAYRLNLVRHARADFRAWVAERDRLVVDAVDAGRTAAAVHAIVTTLNLETGTDAVSPLFDNLYAAELKAAAKEANQARSSAATVRTEVIAAGALGAVAVLVLGIAIGRRVVRPVRRTEEILTKVAAKDLRDRAEPQGHDELGRMSAALNTTLDELNGSLTAIAVTAERLSAAASQLRATGDHLAANAGDTASAASASSNAADEVSASVEATAAAVEQLGATVREIATNVSQVRDVAALAKDHASSAHETIQKLTHSSSEISQVLADITSIAKQTHLLSLNATIEAARAGEAGKGFAIVAGEVKALASQTAEATTSIAEHIEVIQGDVGEAARAIDTVVDIVANISEMQTTVAAAVEEQVATTNEISRSMARAASGTSEIAAGSGSVAAAAGTTTAMVSETRGTAQELAEVAQELEKLVHGFRY